MSPIQLPNSEFVRVVPKYIVGAEASMTAVFNERHQRRTTVTKHPIEGGGNIADHVRSDEPTVELTGFYSDLQISPIARVPVGMMTAYEYLEKLQQDFTLVEVITQQKHYTDMLIVYLDSTKEEGESGVFHFVIILEHFSVSVTDVEIEEFFGLEVSEVIDDRGEVMATDQDPETWFGDNYTGRVSIIPGSRVPENIQSAEELYKEVSAARRLTRWGVNKLPSAEEVRDDIFNRYEESIEVASEEGIAFSEAIVRARCLVEALQ